MFSFSPVLHGYVTPWFFVSTKYSEVQREHGTMNGPSKEISRFSAGTGLAYGKS